MAIGQSIVSFAVGASLALAGCAGGQATGSRPSDMTTQGHCEAAAQERVKAAEAHRAAENIWPNKANAVNRMQAESEMRARQHERYAEQHEQAALVASGGTVPPCHTW